ncbi:MAG: hypothetical protein U0X39_05725 [Bacteroidales bacterium]
MKNNFILRHYPVFLICGLFLLLTVAVRSQNITGRTLKYENISSNGRVGLDKDRFIMKMYQHGNNTYGIALDFSKKPKKLYTLVKFENNTWVPVLPELSLSNDYGTMPSLAFLRDTLCMAFVTDRGSLEVAKYANDKWVLFHDTGISYLKDYIGFQVTKISYLSLVEDDGDLYLTVNGNDLAYVYRLLDNNWILLGNFPPKVYYSDNNIQVVNQFPILNFSVYNKEGYGRYNSVMFKGDQWAFMGKNDNKTQLSGERISQIGNGVYLFTLNYVKSGDKKPTYTYSYNVYNAKNGWWYEYKSGEAKEGKAYYYSIFVDNNKPFIAYLDFPFTGKPRIEEINSGIPDSVINKPKTASSTVVNPDSPAEKILYQINKLTKVFAVNNKTAFAFDPKTRTLTGMFINQKVFFSCNIDKVKIHKIRRPGSATEIDVLFDCIDRAQCVEMLDSKGKQTGAIDLQYVDFVSDEFADKVVALFLQLQNSR